MDYAELKYDIKSIEKIDERLRTCWLDSEVWSMINDKVVLGFPKWQKSPLFTLESFRYALREINIIKNFNQKKTKQCY